MTSTVARRRAGRPVGSKSGPSSTLTFADDFLARAKAIMATATTVTWPSSRWRSDPVGFAHDVLGIRVYVKQREVLEAVRDHPLTTVVSNNKSGKSTAASALALWFFSSFPRARVILTATAQHQLSNVLWREITRLIQESGRCVPCRESYLDLCEAVGDHEAEQAHPRPCPHSAVIQGQLGATPVAGLKTDDLREIVGVVSRTPESAAGLSGEHLLIICDEASGIPDNFFEAITGNLASAGAKLLCIGNGTRQAGYFHRSHHDPNSPFHRIQISAYDSPNVTKEFSAPGLASPQWIARCEQEHGETSAWYRIHVLGLFATETEARLYSDERLDLAETLWHEAPEDTTQRLVLSLDPAGESSGGDESVLMARRGKKVLGIYPARGVTDEGHLAWVLETIELYRTTHPKAPLPAVVLDQEGSVGANILGVFRAHVRQHRDFELVPIRASDRPKTASDARNFDRVRDLMGQNLLKALSEGLVLPVDLLLREELELFHLVEQVSGRSKLMPPKTEIRKLLGRSSDRADALMLSVSSHWNEDIKRKAPPPRGPALGPALPGGGGPRGWDPWSGNAYSRR